MKLLDDVKWRRSCMNICPAISQQVGLGNSRVHNMLLILVNARHCLGGDE